MAAAQAHRTDQAPSTLLYPVGKNVFINTADDCQKAKGTKLLLSLLLLYAYYDNILCFRNFLLSLLLSSSYFSTIRSRPSSFNTTIYYSFCTEDLTNTPRHISEVVSAHFSSFSPLVRAVFVIVALTTTSVVHVLVRIPIN